MSKFGKVRLVLCMNEANHYNLIVYLSKIAVEVCGVISLHSVKT